MGEDAVLADKMSRGELHKPKTSFQKYQEEETLKSSQLDQQQQQGYFTRPAKNYPDHIPLYNFEKLLLIFGSSVGAFLDPSRNEFIVGLGESTALPWFLNNLRRQMLSDAVGRQILKDRPHMTSTSLNLEELRNKYPKNSIGHAYIMWLDREGVSPDTREKVRYIDDEELAFIFRRYRECHDFYHTITGLPIVREGEIALKCFEFLNLGIPMAGLGALFAPWNTSAKQRSRLFNIYYPWAFKNGLHCKPLINVYWEKILDRDIDEFRKEINLEKPPDLRELRKQQKLKHKK
ncbi:hypothetical protein PACTADRAFT_47780 [Pachysolen tannophilus NRRL Y-2460]|uniref:4-hydroxy-3-methoxy-5-polyprenylbenzoate decarboxylase n=1 Tax=Pachysolen tannophilus NRRL Y-2460 TaxID=669874 RepID=A0A1E4U1S1_PACTA|nr:hypothetical protein PACTADRAFT_52200 [Pachysolen tannophilus NRRL Y-2460]ODV97951.1 hypothetical protein PACTADRAFT_47780 [Pachysolen tannophilus NRRL Y-2460]